MPTTSVTYKDAILPKQKTPKKVHFADEPRQASGSGSNASTLGCDAHEIFDEVKVNPKDYLHSFSAYIRRVLDSGSKKSTGEIIDDWLNACFEASEEATTLKSIQAYRKESVSKPLNPQLVALGDTVPALWVASYKGDVVNSSLEFTGDTEDLS